MGPGATPRDNLRLLLGICYKDAVVLIIWTNSSRGPLMADSLRQLRRAVIQGAIRQALTATGVLPIGAQRPVIRSLVTLAGSIPMLRGKVRENMCKALGDGVPAQAENLYFRRLGWLFSSSLSAFHYGITSTAIPEEIQFDESVRVLDDAVSGRCGVVIAAPHWFGHELVAAMINRRHPLAMLVREAETSERMARKLKWYNALGVEIALRPSRAASIRSAVRYLDLLKRGKVLAITPDLLAEPGSGVETCLFGRSARLHGGAFALAIAAKAPMIRCYGRWQADSLVVAFERAPIALDHHERDAAIRAALQDWCKWFEAKLRENPENWLFWLDKRWSQFLRATPRASGCK